MSTDYLEIARYCYRGYCLAPVSASAPKFFGFAEFLTALALMVLVWTLADSRYRFRIRTAPLPLQQTSFAIVTGVGALTLITDLWRAEQWLVPPFDPSLTRWQALLGGFFLLTFLTWTWFALHPAAYGRRNALRYARALYVVILRGSPVELSVIADELTRSARALVRYAPEKRRLQEAADTEQPPRVVAYAHDILLLIGDKRLCRAIVEASPGTALAFFQEVAETEKYGVPIDIFGKNLVREAIANKDSFLYHEAEGYDSGLIGYHKPLTQAMFSNYFMVEEIGSLLDPDYMASRKWDHEQWEAYCRIVLVTFRDFVEKEVHQHSFVLFRAKGIIEHAAFDLYKLNGSETGWDAEVLATLRVIVRFVTDTIGILNENSVPEWVKRRKLGRDRNRIKTIYDHMADLIFEIMFTASAVRTPVDFCWAVQHNSVWGEIFNFGHGDDGEAAEVIKFKVRRLLYNEVVRMTTLPNFKGAALLGFCLNVMGLRVSAEDYFNDSRALQKAVLSWTKKHYARIHDESPGVAERCLVGRISYDAGGRRLVKTYSDERLRKDREEQYFVVDPAPARPATSGG